MAVQPSLAHMFAQDFHHTVVGRYLIVRCDYLRGRDAARDFKERGETVGFGFIRTHHAEVAIALVQLHDVAHKAAELPSRFFRPVFFFNDTATTEIYTLSLHDALLL